VSLIETRDLRHAYTLPRSGEVWALRGISLSVESGEYVAIVGANGSGKTTLARHLNGILQPTSGTIAINELSTSDVDSIAEIRKTVGMVFQSPDDQLVATVVEEDVAFGPENAGLPPEEIERRVHDALVAVDMWDHRSRPTHQLSEGQKQRVALAGALAVKPRILVLDEATSMLDPAGSHAMLKILDQLHREGLTILTITHKMVEAARAERIVVMHNGEIADDGSPAVVFAREELATWGLAPPPIAQLVREVKDDFPSLATVNLDPASLARAIGALV